MKKTLNSVLAFILSVVIVFGGVPIAGVAGLTGWFEGLSVTASAENYSGTCGANLTWQIDTSTGVLTISGTGAMNNWSSGSPVPWSSYRSSITNVTIGSGVTSIGDYAFRFCSKITSITISDSVTSIGDYVFRGCSKLASLVIPNSVTRIGDYAFCSCYRLESITIPGTVTSIGIRPLERFITVDSDNQYYSNDASNGNQSISALTATTCAQRRLTSTIIVFQTPFQLPMFISAREACRLCMTIPSS